MIQFLDYRPVPNAPRIAVTRPASLRNARPGIVEVKLVRSCPHPRSIITYEEAATIIWPAEALAEVTAIYSVAIPAILREILH